MEAGPSPDAVLALDPASDVAAVVRRLPARPAVVQLLGQDGRSLLVGLAASGRRWAQAQLGLLPPAAKGRRPRVDLRPVARELRLWNASSGLHQRLVYERLMAGLVPLASRRDLKRPAWLRLDVAERFPRLAVTVGAEPADAPLHFGPFRDRGAAGRARDLLQRRLALRPCDYSFEPDPGLALGQACTYAQVRSCSAPCLARVAAPEYRALARQALAALGAEAARDGELAAAIPEWVAPAEPQAALAFERGREGIELYPVVGGRIREDGRLLALADATLADAVRALRFEASPAGPGDWPWLLAWLREPRRKGHLLALRDTDDRAGLLARVAERLAVT